MFIGIDIGGTNIRIGAFDKAKRVVCSVRKFPTADFFKDGIEEIKNEIDQLTKHNAIEGIGIAIAVPLDKRGNMIFNANLHDWNPRILAEDLKEKYQTRVKYINDASAGGLAEIRQKDESFAYFTWGTGLGGVFVEKVKNKVKLFEFEPGHMKIVENGRKCTCGKRGCLEAYIGGKATQAHYGKDIKNFSNKEWDEICVYLTDGLSKILATHPVDRVIFGGGIFLKRPDFIKTVTKKILCRLPSSIDFCSAKYGDKNVLHGSVRLFDQGLEITKEKLDN